jgi:hypothetical protein
MRVLDRFLVAVYIALAVLPVVAMVAGIRGRAVFGALPPAPRPKVELSAIIDEKFQTELVAWFESNLGLKGNSIAFDNGVLYRVFGETKYGAFVRLGKDRILFPHEDIDFFNKNGRWVTDPAYVEKLADQIAMVQRTLRGRGRAFVPVLIPSKTTIYRDKIPERWIMDIPAPRPADQTVRLVREALDRRGVVYVNAIDIFRRSFLPREYLFGPDARHWSEYGACLALDAVADRYSELTGKPRPLHRCEPTFSSKKPRRIGEWDLWRVLNASFTRKTVRRMPRAAYAPVANVDPASRPRTLFVGTSFCWTLFFDADDSGAFGTLHYNYYNQVFIGPDTNRIDLKAGTDTWREITMDKDLYVLDLFESYLAAPASYVDLFLTDFMPALEQAR